MGGFGREGGEGDGEGCGSEQAPEGGAADLGGFHSQGWHISW